MESVVVPAQPDGLREGVNSLKEDLDAMVASSIIVRCGVECFDGCKVEPGGSGTIAFGTILLSFS